MSQRWTSVEEPGDPDLTDQPLAGVSANGSSVHRPRAQSYSERLRLRRGLGHLGMTLVVPGSAQLVSGDRRIGKWAIRIWAALLLLALSFVALLLFDRGLALTLAVSRPVAISACVVLALAGLGWAALMLDAWRISHPPALAQRHRLGFGLLSLGLALALGGGLIASAAVVNSESDLLSTVFAGGGDSTAKAGRYNVLLMGGDAGTGREGLRPDSMTIASIDARTGRTVLFSLPRNMEDIQFPAGSPMKQLYPDRFTCPDHQCMLNAVYTKATEHKELYPGVRDPGARATVEAAEWVTGLDINYYVLIDLKGFKSLIDAVGGINVDVGKRVPVGGGSTEVSRYIEPGANQHFDGQNALWFARSRHDSTDYERMTRQKCVMNAMLNQLEPVTVLTKFNEIARAGKEIVETDVPSSEMNRLGDLALKARQQEITSEAFVPPLIQPGEPDFAVLRHAVAARIAEAEGRPVPTAAAAPTSSATPSATPRGQSTRATRRPTSATTTTTGAGGPSPVRSATPTPTAPVDHDLSSICRAS